ncbi:DNA topoisomerase 1 [subsurface metagenome]
MKLIIVESPRKSRTLKQFLGTDYQFAATLGHIRDLPQKKLGVDIEKDFRPKYVTIPGKRKTIKNLKEQLIRIRVILFKRGLN